MMVNISGGWPTSPKRPLPAKGKQSGKAGVQKEEEAGQTELAGEVCRIIKLNIIR